MKDPVGSGSLQPEDGLHARVGVLRVVSRFRSNSARTNNSLASSGRRATNDHGQIVASSCVPTLPGSSRRPVRSDRFLRCRALSGASRSAEWGSADYSSRDRRDVTMGRSAGGGGESLRQCCGVRRWSRAGEALPARRIGNTDGDDASGRVCGVPCGRQRARVRRRSEELSADAATDSLPDVSGRQHLERRHLRPTGARDVEYVGDIDRRGGAVPSGFRIGVVRRRNDRHPVHRHPRDSAVGADFVLV